MQTKHIIQIIILSCSCLFITSNASAAAWDNWGRWVSGIHRANPSGCGDLAGGACNQDRTLSEANSDALTEAGFPIYALALFATGVNIEEFSEEEFLYLLLGLGEGGFEGSGIGIGTAKGGIAFDEESEEIFASFLSGFSDGSSATGPLILVDPENAFLEPIEEFSGDNFDGGFFAFFENDALGFGGYLVGFPTDNMSELMSGEGTYATYSGSGLGIGDGGLSEWDVYMSVDFGDASWDGEFHADYYEGCSVCHFYAAGDISGSDFSSTYIGEGEEEVDITGFVEGTFFGTDAPELGGRFEVSNEYGTDNALFTASQGEICCDEPVLEL